MIDIIIGVLPYIAAMLVAVLFFLLHHLSMSSMYKNNMPFLQEKY